MSLDIAHNLAAVRQQINAVAAEFGRNPAEIHLLAVSKTQPIDAVRAAIAAGQRAFGENYLQDALPKIEALRDFDLEWHYIGPLQSNKTRPIAENFSWVQSLDSLKHARRLNEQRPDELPPLNICVQVNSSGEVQKSGIAPEELSAFVNALQELPRLRLRGLMTVPAICDDFNAQRRPFQLLASLYQDLQAQGLALDTLSMGMTADLRAAIAEGATMVRIGTAIFGARHINQYLS